MYSPCAPGGRAACVPSSALSGTHPAHPHPHPPTRHPNPPRPPTPPLPARPPAPPGPDQVYEAELAAPMTAKQADAAARKFAAGTLVLEVRGWVVPWLVAEGLRRVLCFA